MFSIRYDYTGHSCFSQMSDTSVNYICLVFQFTLKPKIVVTLTPQIEFRGFFNFQRNHTKSLISTKNRFGGWMDTRTLCWREDKICSLLYDVYRAFFVNYPHPYRTLFPRIHQPACRNVRNRGFSACFNIVQNFNKKQ